MGSVAPSCSQASLAAVCVLPILVLLRVERGGKLQAGGCGGGRWGCGLCCTKEKSFIWVSHTLRV